MKCTNCGAQLQDGTLFCTECGTKVILPESQVANANEATQNSGSDNSQNNFGQQSDSAQFQNNFGQQSNGAQFQNANFQQPEMGSMPQNNGQSYNNNIYAGVPDPAATVNNGQNKGKKSKILIPIIAVLVLVLAAVGGLFFYLKSRPIEVNLQEYVTVNFDGYDSLGTATVEFDDSKFKEDFGDKLKYHGDDKDMKDKSAKKLIAQYFDDAISLDKAEELSNGDTVTVEFEYDADQLLEDLNIKTSTDGITFTVKGLEEIPTFDPFEGLEITYFGTAPNAYASLDTSNVTNEYYDNYDYIFNYEYEDLKNLSNGDVITITIKYDDEESDEEFISYFVELYGVMPTQISKEFTVEGLQVSVTSKSQITDDVLKQMQDYLEDQEIMYTSSDIGTELTNDGEVTLSAVEYYGMYIGEPKDETSYYNDVEAYLTYKISINYKSEDYSFYCVVGMDDLVLDGDGNLVTEKVSTDLYKYEYLSHNFKDGYHVYGMHGYETTADIEDDLSYYSTYYNFSWVLAGSDKSSSSDSAKTADATTDSSEEASDDAQTEETTDDADNSEASDEADKDSSAE